MSSTHHFARSNSSSDNSLVHQVKVSERISCLQSKVNRATTTLCDSIPDVANKHKVLSSLSTISIEDAVTADGVEKVLICMEQKVQDSLNAMQDSLNLNDSHRSHLFGGSANAKISKIDVICSLQDGFRHIKSNLCTRKRYDKPPITSLAFMHNLSILTLKAVKLQNHDELCELYFRITDLIDALNEKVNLVGEIEATKELVSSTVGLYAHENKGVTYLYTMPEHFISAMDHVINYLKAASQADKDKMHDSTQAWAQYLIQYQISKNQSPFGLVQHTQTSTKYTRSNKHVADLYKSIPARSYHSASSHSSKHSMVVNPHDSETDNSSYGLLDKDDNMATIAAIEKTERHLVVPNHTKNLNMALPEQTLNKHDTPVNMYIDHTNYTDQHDPRHQISVSTRYDASEHSMHHTLDENADYADSDANDSDASFEEIEKLKVLNHRNQGRISFTSEELNKKSSAIQDASSAFRQEALKKIAHSSDEIVVVDNSSVGSSSAYEKPAPLLTPRSKSKYSQTYGRLAPMEDDRIDEIAKLREVTRKLQLKAAQSKSQANDDDETEAHKESRKSNHNHREKHSREDRREDNIDEYESHRTNLGITNSKSVPDLSVREASSKRYANKHRTMEDLDIASNFSVTSASTNTTSFSAQNLSNEMSEVIRLLTPRYCGDCACITFKTNTEVNNLFSQVVLQALGLAAIYMKAEVKGGASLIEVEQNRTARKTYKKLIRRIIKLNRDCHYSRERRAARIIDRASYKTTKFKSDSESEKAMNSLKKLQNEMLSYVRKCYSGPKERDASKVLLVYNAAQEIISACTNGNAVCEHLQVIGATNSITEKIDPNILIARSRDIRAAILACIDQMIRSNRHSYQRRRLATPRSNKPAPASLQPSQHTWLNPPAQTHIVTQPKVVKIVPSAPAITDEDLNKPGDSSIMKPHTAPHTSASFIPMPKPELTMPKPKFTDKVDRLPATHVSSVPLPMETSKSEKTGKLDFVKSIGSRIGNGFSSLGREIKSVASSSNKKDEQQKRLDAEHLKAEIEKRNLRRANVSHSVPKPAPRNNHENNKRPPLRKEDIQVQHVSTTPPSTPATPDSTPPNSSNSSPKIVLRTGTTNAQINSRPVSSPVNPPRFSLSPNATKLGSMRQVRIKHPRAATTHPINSANISTVDPSATYPTIVNNRPLNTSTFGAGSSGLHLQFSRSPTNY